MGALGGKGKYTALGLRRQGQSSQGWSECLHAKLPGALLDECPDSRVRNRGSEKIMLARSGEVSLARQPGGQPWFLYTDQM